MRTSITRTRLPLSTLIAALSAALLGGGGCLVEVGPEEADGTRGAAASGSAGASAPSGTTVSPGASVSCGVTYHVRAAAAAGGDGSATAPFCRIGDALAAAASPSICGVTIELAAGTYFENLTITKHTTLHGADRTATVLRGRIGNSTPARLTIERLKIASAGAPGAVVVNNAAAVTTIRDVTIDRASRYGVRQSGGTLNISMSTISYTSSGWDHVHQGTAVLVDGGATAYLGTVVMRGGAQGLVASGAGTRARATSLEVRDCRRNYWFRDLLAAGPIRAGFAAVEALDGALIYARWLDLYDNDVYGLSVHHGGRGYVYRGRFLRTRAVTVTGASSPIGGINASVRHGGSELVLRETEAGHGALAGVQAYQAYLTQRDGTIHHNPVGMHVNKPADLDWRCLTLGATLFIDNDTNIQSTPTYVPTPVLPGEPPPPPPVCPSVSW